MMPAGTKDVGAERTRGCPDQNQKRDLSSKPSQTGPKSNLQKPSNGCKLGGDATPLIAGARFRACASATQHRRAAVLALDVQLERLRLRVVVAHPRAPLRRDVTGLAVRLLLEDARLQHLRQHARSKSHEGLRRRIFRRQRISRQADLPHWQNSDRSHKKSMREYAAEADDLRPGRARDGEDLLDPRTKYTFSRRKLDRGSRNVSQAHANDVSRKIQLQSCTRRMYILPGLISALHLGPQATGRIPYR